VIDQHYSHTQLTYSSPHKHVQRQKETTGSSRNVYGMSRKMMSQLPARHLKLILRLNLL